MKQEKLKAFISYAHKDTPYMNRIHNIICSSPDITATFDNSFIRGGTDFFNHIYHEIFSCSVFIVVLSENYCSSKFCMAELAEAASFGKPILAVDIGINTGTMEQLDSEHARHLKNKVPFSSFSTDNITSIAGPKIALRRRPVLTDNNQKAETGTLNFQTVSSTSRASEGKIFKSNLAEILVIFLVLYFVFPFAVSYPLSLLFSSLNIRINDAAAVILSILILIADVVCSYLLISLIAKKKNRNYGNTLKIIVAMPYLTLLPVSGAILSCVYALSNTGFNFWAIVLCVLSFVGCNVILHLFQLYSVYPEDEAFVSKFNGLFQTAFEIMTGISAIAILISIVGEAVSCLTNC